MIPDLTARLSRAGYEARRPELLALSWALSSRPRAGARALLLEGPPGAGKTALAEAVAAAFGWPLIVGQMHAWTDADELFVGVDVAAAVAGDAAAVRQPGLLARAAELSERGHCVLLLDEVDKTSERAEALLLDWLQSGRVPVQPGRHLRTRQDNVLVILTSNGARELGDALLRRVRRVQVSPLPLETALRLLTGRSGAPAGVVKVAWKRARAVAESEGTLLSLQEGLNLLEELQQAGGIEDLRLSLAGWAARTATGAAAARSADVSDLWAEILRARRAGWGA